MEPISSKMSGIGYSEFTRSSAEQLEKTVLILKNIFLEAEYCVRLK
jgi:hypothetical protein